MTPEKLNHLAALQESERLGTLTEASAAYLEQLRRELAALPEKADDPATLFTDESRRPRLDGTDWNDMNRAMCRDEVGNFVKMAVAKFGAPLVEAAFAAAFKR